MHIKIKTQNENWNWIQSLLTFWSVKFIYVSLIKPHTVDTQGSKVCKRLRWSRGSALPLSTQVGGFKPGQSCQDFEGRKFLSAPSFGGDVKPSVPCRRFTACKRSLNVVWKSTLRQIYWLIFLPISLTFCCLDLSRRVGRGDIWLRKWECLKHKGG
jgi:hypothetical protein